MNPRFSIIVPVYKTEQYLHQCVDSILGQSFTDFEVILVDDGSPDGSGAICDEYAAKDSRIKVVHKENGGLVSARKAGLAVCTGEYVVNVDSDDYIASDLLERVANILQKSAVQAVLFGAIRFSGENQWKLQSFLRPGRYTDREMDRIREGLIQDERGELTVLYNVWAMAVDRKVYTPYQNAVPNTISRGEDLAVTVPLLAHCNSVYVLDYCGYYYRNNPASIMNSFRIDEISQMMQLAVFLSQNLSAFYEAKIDMYVLLHYFDFLDRAMLQGWKAYRNIIRQTRDDKMLIRIRRARCNGDLKLKGIFFLMRYECYTLLWVLRKMKKRA